MEIEDLQELVSHLTLPRRSDASPGVSPSLPRPRASPSPWTSHEQATLTATAAFDAASNAVGTNASQMAALFCGFLEDSYYEARLDATTSAEDAMTSSALASAAALADPSATNIYAAERAGADASSKAELITRATGNITASKVAIASRMVRHFPSIVSIIAAAQAANMSAVETQHVVVGTCFSVIEAGLSRNALTRGAIGPECPVCLEDFDVSSEDMAHSPVILQCVFPLDYAHGAMHPICNGCWAKIKNVSAKHNSHAKCPVCRATTTGRSVSQCAYNIMIDLIVV